MLLDTMFKDNLRVDIHVNVFVKHCGQLSFLIKQLHCQGLSNKQLDTVLEANILSQLWYALPAWG
jgi:hypothetical protein